MSQIANIEVNRCDSPGCLEVAVLRSDEDHDEFVETWFAGLEIDFCRKCKYKIEHQAQIAEEEQRIADFEAGTFRQIRAEKRKDYVH